VTKMKMRKLCFELFRSLKERKILEVTPQGKVYLNIDLQLDFSLNQTLSIFMLDALQLLDKEDPSYHLRVLSVVESIHEDPDLILRRQLNRLKTIRMNEMKNEGLEYEERMAELEKMEHPKPEKEFIYHTFNAFAALHPWIGQESVHPKGVAREIYEDYYSFNEYIKEYDIARSEGVLLRYVSYVYKSLAQSIPDSMKTEELWAIESYFGTMLQNVDSSLLEEWTRLDTTASRISGGTAHSGIGQDDPSDLVLPPKDITRSKKEFTVLVRNAVYAIVRSLALKNFAEAAAQFSTSNHELCEPITSSALETFMVNYDVEHMGLCFDTVARGAKHTKITNIGVSEKGDDFYWQLEQTLVDKAELNDVVLTVLVNVDASREAQKPVLSFVSLVNL
jgi:hypothetical protein